MGYRTHLILKKAGPLYLDKELMLSFSTCIYYLDNYCIGKVYFDELPNCFRYDEKTDTELNIWFNDDTYMLGEISVADILILLYKLQKNKMKEINNNPWYTFSYHDLLSKLEHLLEHKRITPDDYIKFEVF